MRSLRLALAGLLAALGLVALTATPSHACSCAVSGTEQYVDYADTVFTGTLASIEEAPPAGDGTVSSMDPTTYVFEVDRVLEGDVPATTEVRSARFGASCGLEGMVAGETYVVFASTDRGGLEANLCGGTRPETSGFVDRVAELTGSGQPAAPAFSAIAAALLAFFAWPS